MSARDGMHINDRIFAVTRRGVVTAGALFAAATAASAATAAPNPFAEPSALPYEAPPFDRISDTDYQPAIEEGITASLAEIRAIADNPAPPTFDNTIVALERQGQELARAQLAFGQVTQANTNPTLQKAQAALAQAYTVTEKQQRHARLGEIKTQTLTALTGGEAPKFTKEQVEGELFKLESNIVRQRILNGEPRIDGRDTKTVRPISVKVGVLPRTHGSALFTRGETQALVTVTLTLLSSMSGLPTGLAYRW